MSRFHNLTGIGIEDELTGHIYNNKNEIMGVMEFGIVRNNLYRMLITNVKDLGEPIPVIDPDIPDEGETYLSVLLNVKPWIVRDLTNIEL